MKKKTPILAPFWEAKAIENHVKSGHVRSRHFKSKKGRTGKFCSPFLRRRSEYPSYKEGSALENPSISYVFHYLGTFESKMGWILSKMKWISSIRLEIGRPFGALGTLLGALETLLGHS